MSAIIYNPPCYYCKHFNAKVYETIPRNFCCTVFPDGIPEMIRIMEFDHRFPYEGDNGTQFEKNERVEDLPKWIRESNYERGDLYDLMICEMEERRLKGKTQPPITREEMQFQETFYQMFTRIANKVKQRLIAEGHLPEDSHG